MANYGWSSVTQFAPYPKYGVEKPASPDFAPVAESLGPILLNDAQGNLTARWWAAWHDNTLGKVFIAGQDGDTYGAPVEVFSEASEVTQIALTFDQQGNPLIFYKLNTSALKLYWFDPVLSSTTITDIADGNFPVACFDYPPNTNLSFTDAHIFYVSLDGKIKNRVQRDRFLVEYQVQRNGVDAAGFMILSAGLTVENRLQVEYR